VSEASPTTPVSEGHRPPAPNCTTEERQTAGHGTTERPAEEAKRPREPMSGTQLSLDDPAPAGERRDGHERSEWQLGRHRRGRGWSGSREPLSHTTASGR